MAIRIHKINAGATFTPFTGANVAAKLFSTVTIEPKPGRGVISAGVPDDTDTIEITYVDFGGTPTSVTYTFLDSPSSAREVQRVGGDFAATMQNFQAEILEQDSTILKAFFESGSLVIENATAGLDNDANLAHSGTGTLTIDNADALGHNGALLFNGDTFDVIVTSSTNSVTISVSESDDATSLASHIDGQVTGATVTALASNRLQIEHSTTGTGETLEVDNYVSVGFRYDLFEEEIADGKSVNHPSSDTSNSKIIELAHPFEPYDFRYDNRVFIGLAENDREIYREFIALRDGYDIDSGAEIDSADLLSRFKAKGGMHVDTDLHVYGDIIQHGGQVLQQNEEVLIVADKTITLNSGETGTGVGGNTRSGLIIDRGTIEDVSFLWRDDEDIWELDGPIIGTTNGGKSLVVGNQTLGGTVVEQEQVSIGDGINTFGTFNGTDFTSVLNSALTALPSGGKVFVKRGSYTLSANVTINVSNILILGESAAAYINTGSNKIIVDGVSDISNVKFENIRLETDAASSCIDLGGSNQALNTIILGCWFEGAGTDVELTNENRTVATANVSTTATTNL